MIIGGVLTALGSFVVALTMDRRASQAGLRSERLKAAGEVLASLQNLNRKLINIARHPDPQGADDSEPIWVEQLEAATRWNSARYSASLVCPDEQIDLLDALDREVDKVFDAALARHWSGREFRSSRQELGRLGARYLTAVRGEALGTSTKEIETLWAWEASSPTDI